MKIDVKVKNLGKIKEAEFHIRPMTVITGPNGTGKSFFTKSLYSILNVINKNVYHESVRHTIQQIQLNLSLVGDDGTDAITTKIITNLDILKNEFEEASNWKIDNYHTFATSKVGAVNSIYDCYKLYFESRIKMPFKSQTIKELAEGINKLFDDFSLLLKNPVYYHEVFFINRISSEIKDNFQISSLSELISFGEDIILIEVDELLKIELSNTTVSLKLGSDFIDEVSNLSSVVFFESPAYWKVREALISAKNRPRLFRIENFDSLIGVPKYFYDLDDVLNIKTKTEGAFKSATDILENTLGGEFIFKGDNLSFSDSNGREISKHLVSFGMTNLGMIQALLKYNIITPGSFIFIDEPETNLHPDWQVKLVEVLLMLAKGGVNVVITTHSSDLVKALEVKIKKQQIDVMEDFLSVHYVDYDGKLYEFESEDKLQQLIEARSLLNSAYEELYFSDL